MHTLQQLQSGQLAGMTRLDLGCNLSQFPREIFELADTLEVLNLSGNQLSTLPDDLPRLKKLKIIFCSNNDFTELPAVLGQCEQLEMIGFRANRIQTIPATALPLSLRALTLTDNHITTLPDEIGHCAQLQKLMLAGNRLTALPASLAGCSQLELIRIAANRFAALPEVVLHLPRLAWLAYAGNPFCAELERRAAMHQIDWNELEIGVKLGEGASGQIYQARHGANHVAVKLFKSAVTSDGIPHCEIAASLAAGAHPNLIAVHGQIANHPEGSDALVLDLIAPNYTPLAQPPSLASCTRDIYHASTTFTPAQAEAIYEGIASAVNHINSRGLIHGDVYAHNVLCNQDGGALLGDFGAASFCSPVHRQALLEIEQRALAHLHAELSARTI
ncbi:leucine-rich repeat-containing protein kinase family protein [Chitinibacter sp. S2-10]|uniref:leucine-rich repeat-containing protein kinase family protein n=1 Tax=Chitinibacter sp. S2-10 TaxID=3373597 RepID=UPI003977295C